MDKVKYGDPNRICDKKCNVCKGPSYLKYCSRNCHRKAWKKRCKNTLKCRNESCKNKAHNKIYCSVECQEIDKAKILLINAGKKKIRKKKKIIRKKKKVVKKVVKRKRKVVRKRRVRKIKITISNCLKCDTVIKISNKYRDPNYKLCDSCFIKKRAELKNNKNLNKKIIYKINNNFFTHHKNIVEIYETIGFLFSTALIFNPSAKEDTYNKNWSWYDINIICIDREPLENFNKIIKCKYPINPTSDPIIGASSNRFRIVINNYTWRDYLEYIGLGMTSQEHTYPIILPKYIPIFIKGYITNRELYEKYEKEDHVVHVIKGKSYSLIRGITDFLGGEFITNKLHYCCIFKDYTDIMNDTFRLFKKRNLSTKKALK